MDCICNPLNQIYGSVPIVCLIAECELMYIYIYKNNNKSNGDAKEE